MFVGETSYVTLRKGLGTIIMPNANGMPTYDELRSLSESDLEKSIDRQYSMTPNERHLLIAQLFRDELARRGQERSTAAMLEYTVEVRDLTRQIRNLTWIILGATMHNFGSDNAGTRRFGCCASRCTSIRAD